MGLFKGGLTNAFNNIVNSVTNGVTNVVSGVASGVLQPVSGVVGQTIATVTPLVKDVMNSSVGNLAAGSAASVFGGENLSADTAAAIASIGGPTPGRPANFKTAAVDMSPRTGLKKFFCYRKLDDKGVPVLDSNGNYQTNWVKVIVHGTVVIAVSIGIYKWVKGR